MLHEGYRERAYQDSVGIWTIGYGTNLQTLQIDRDLAETWLLKKLDEAEKFANTLPEWAVLDGPRRDVVVEMIYNLGPHGYSLFVNTRLAMQEGRYEDAARGMLASKWAKQVGLRAIRLAAQMRTGVRWNEDYNPRMPT
jgi:lysozyme